MVLLMPAAVFAGDTDILVSLPPFSLHLYASQDPAVSSGKGEDDDGDLAIESQLTVSCAFAVAGHAYMQSCMGGLFGQSATPRAMTCVQRRRAASAKRRRPLPSVTPAQQTTKQAKEEPASQTEALVLQSLGVAFALILLEGLILAASVRHCCSHCTLSLLCGLPCRTLLCPRGTELIMICSHFTGVPARGN